MTDHFRPTTGIFKGAAIFFLASLVGYILRFATSVIVARTLGPDGKGVYILLVTLGAFLVLFFNFGLNAAITYLTARKAFSTKDLFSFAVAAALFWGLIGILVFLPFYRLALAETLLAGVSQGYIYWVSVLFPVSLLVSFLISILLGQQFLFQYNLVEVGRLFANLVLQILAAYLGWGLTGAVVAWLIANLAALGLVIWFTRASISLRINRIRNIIRPAFSYGARSYVANLLTFFNYRLDSFLVNFFVGTAAVGLYSTSVSVAELLYYLPNAISSALFPKIPTLNPEAASQLTARLCRLVLLVALPLCLAFGLAGFFLIPLVFGSPFQPAVMPFLLLLPGIIGISLSKILAADLSGRGKPQYSMYTSIFTVIITIILDVLLIPRGNIQGAAVASTIAYLASAVLYVNGFSKETHSSWQAVIVPTASDLSLVIRRSSEILQGIRLKLKRPSR